MASVLYRRLAGKIRLGTDETGTRGAWWEKRRAFLRWLALRGHAIHEALNNGGTRDVWFPGMPMHHEEPPPLAEATLIIEHGSTNTQFYGADIEATVQWLGRVKRVVWLCDDPALPFPWGRVPLPALPWVSWVNCTLPWPNVPSWAGQRFFPFGSLLPANRAKGNGPDYLWYAGRPDGGRGKKLADIAKAIAPRGVRILGRRDEWTEWPDFVVLPMPEQPKRPRVYGAAYAMMGLADSTHKRLGWRTGRIDHAAAAGCPVIIESDHVGPAAGWPLVAATGADVRTLLDRMGNGTYRETVIRQQTEQLKSLQLACEQAAEEVSL